MDAKWFVLRFEGRINRARYWLTAFILLCSMVSALMLLATISKIFGIATGTPLHQHYRRFRNLRAR
jgi:uncharacterized membrane protein YhaH (DUF805 family)